MTEREQLIRQIVQTEIGYEENVIALGSDDASDETEFLKKELIRDAEIVSIWKKNYDITNEDILSVRKQVLESEFSEVSVTEETSRENAKIEYEQRLISIKNDSDKKRAMIDELISKPMVWQR